MVGQRVQCRSTDGNVFFRGETVQIIDCHRKLDTLSNSLNFDNHLSLNQRFPLNENTIRTCSPTLSSSISSSSRNRVISLPSTLIKTSLGFSLRWWVPTTSMPVSSGTVCRTQSSVALVNPSRLTRLKGYSVGSTHRQTAFRSTTTYLVIKGYSQCTPGHIFSLPY